MAEWAFTYFYVPESRIVASVRVKNSEDLEGFDSGLCSLAWKVGVENVTIERLCDADDPSKTVTGYRFVPNLKS